MKPDQLMFDYIIYWSLLVLLIVWVDFGLGIGIGLVNKKKKKTSNKDDLKSSSNYNRRESRQSWCPAPLVWPSALAGGIEMFKLESLPWLEVFKGLTRPGVDKVKPKVWFKYFL